MTVIDVKPYLDGDVTFEYFLRGNLYYRTKNGFLFPVPISDCGDGRFLAKDKALLYMRYIRKFLEVTEGEET